MSSRSRLEVILDFLSQPMVWITIVVAIVLGFGLAGADQVEHMIGVIADALAKMKPW